MANQPEALVRSLAIPYADGDLLPDGSLLPVGLSSFHLGLVKAVRMTTAASQSATATLGSFGSDRLDYAGSEYDPKSVVSLPDTTPGIPPTAGPSTCSYIAALLDTIGRERVVPWGEVPAVVDIRLPNSSDLLADSDGTSEQQIASTHERVIVRTVCSATRDPSLIVEARKLTAKKYLERGFIQPHELHNGVIADDDPHARSTYYVLRDELDDNTTSVIATLRKIHWDSNLDEKSFPLWERRAMLDPAAVAEIEAIGLHRCVEISTHVREEALDPYGMAALQLDRSLLQDSLKRSAVEHNEEVYLMAVSPVLFDILTRNFDGYVQRIGPDLDYPGQVAIPVMIRPREAVIDALNRLSEQAIDDGRLKSSVLFLLEGLDESDLDIDVAQALARARAAGVLEPVGSVAQNEMPVVGVTRTAVLEVVGPEGASADASADATTQRLLEPLGAYLRRRRPEYIAAAGLIAYTIARTLGVAKGISPTTEVDWRVFLGIEIITTPPYVRGMGDLARAIANPETSSRNKKIGAIALAGTSFLAPYAYVLAKGGDMPKSAWWGVVALLTVSAGSVLRRLYRTYKSRDIGE